MVIKELSSMWCSPAGHFTEGTSVPQSHSANENLDFDSQTFVFPLWSGLGQAWSGSIGGFGEVRMVFQSFLVLGFSVSRDPCQHLPVP